MCAAPAARPGGCPDQAIADTLAATLEHEIVRDHPPDRRPALRDAHPKAHGCVRATFRVESDLEEDLRHGVFKPGQEYQAWIRFSNALKVRHDLVRDARGMAIKLLAVGIDNETPGWTSQDFLLVTHHAFFIADAKEYLDFPATVFSVKPAIALYVRLTRFFFGISPPRFRWRGAWAVARSQRWTSSPLVLRYFSQVPFRMGPHGQAKFCAVPRQGPGILGGLGYFFLVLAYSVPMPPGMKERAFRRSKDLLRQRLRHSLAQRPALFDFCVQLRSDPDEMPLDDATVPWRHSAFRKVATIEIPPQESDTEDRMALAEHLSYSPWHALPDHKPLGSINELRRTVYQRIATLRHDLNHKKLRDPRPNESPAEFLAAIQESPGHPPARD